MKKKQLIGIIVTGVVIIAIGVTGILSNIVAGYFSRDMEDSSMLRDFFSNHDDFTHSWRDWPRFFRFADILGCL